MASIVFWMVAQVPQFVKNIKQQRADALSAWFLAEWLLVRSVCSSTVRSVLEQIIAVDASVAALQGDTCNLIGCLMTGNQLPTVTYTAM